MGAHTTKSKSKSQIANRLVTSARTLHKAVEPLRFASPVTHVYNPLAYAWSAHEQYLRRYATSQKKIIFLGMNPGPFGMAQTGVPFGEVTAVRDWLGIDAAVDRPSHEHPKRPVEGLQCRRSEVSGLRLWWGLFAERFGKAEVFSREHFVANYCPLVFFQESGRNLTPDKLPARETTALYEACDRHLQALADALQPAWVIAIGKFAESRAHEALSNHNVQIGRILHPSPSNPAANRNWRETALNQLISLGVWKPNPNA